MEDILVFSESVEGSSVVLNIDLDDANGTGNLITNCGTVVPIIVVCTLFRYSKYRVIIRYKLYPEKYFKKLRSSANKIGFCIQS